MITSKERKEKEEELKQSDLRPTTYETIFQPKEPVRLESLFERDEFRNTSKKRVLIQGSAGIGKSTLCQNIAYQWVQAKPWLSRFKAVFWLKFRDLTREKYPANADYTVYQIIEREFGFASGQIADLLKEPEFRADCLLILDGYDEFSDEGLKFRSEKRTPLASLVEAFQKAFHHIIITTRPQEVANFEKDANLEILGFEDSGIKEYINKFFSHKGPFEKEKKNESKQAIENQLQNPLVRGLCHIPINLEIFCSLALEEETFPVSQPLRIAQIYDRLTDWLMRRFFLLKTSMQREDALAPLPQEHEKVANAMQALEELAWKGLIDNRLYFKNTDQNPEITNILRAHKINISDVTKVGPFRISNKEGQFIHLTFQEFFAAKYLVRLLEEKKEEVEKIIAEKKFHPRFQLVFSMTSGLLAQNKDVLQKFFDILYALPRDLGKSREAILFARYFEECGNEAKAVSWYETFTQSIVSLLEDPLILYKTKLDFLNRNQFLLDSDKVIDFFLDKLKKPDRNFLFFLANLAAQKNRIPEKILTEEALEGITSLLSDPKVHAFERGEAAETLKEIVKSGGVLPEKALKGLSSANDFMRGQATEPLGVIMKAEGALPEKTSEDLISLLSDPKTSAFVRGEAGALKEIVKAGGTLPGEALEGLISLLSDPKAVSFARGRVAEPLGAIVKAEGALPEKTSEDLISLLSDPKANAFARREARALQEIVKKGGTLPMALEEVTSLLSDPKAGDFARGAAAEALREIVKTRGAFPEKALEGLISLLSDPKANVFARGEAAGTLGEIVKSGGALPEKALKELISLLSDPKANVFARGEAAEALKQAVKAKAIHSRDAIERICRICGIAFYEERGQYYIADERDVYSINAPTL